VPQVTSTRRYCGPEFIDSLPLSDAGHGEVLLSSAK
jgi:hypothetical protein